MSALRPPRLRTASSSDERSATWLELFYDLVFVVAVAALGHRLLVDHSPQGVVIFAALFVPLWWSWASYTFYADRFDTDDLGQRLLAVAQMVAIALMAASTSGDTADSTMAFAIWYVAAKTVLLIMYLRAYRHVEATQKLVAGYLRGFSLGLLPWIVSIWVPEPWRFLLWGIGLAIDFATPWIMRREQANVPLSQSHLPERFGLFTILVLGESITAIVAGISSVGWQTDATVGAALGVIIATGLWWLYFDNLEGSVVRRVRGKVKAWKPTVWIYIHLPLAIGLTASGIGLEFLVAQEGPSLRWIAVGGIAVALVSMSILQVATVRDEMQLGRALTTIRIAGATVVLAIGFMSSGWASNAILAALAVVCFAQIGLDLFMQERSSATQAST